MDEAKVIQPVRYKHEVDNFSSLFYPLKYYQTDI